MDRRQFLQSLAAAAVARPFIFDMGANLWKSEARLEEVYVQERNWGQSIAIGFRLSTGYTHGLVIRPNTSDIFKEISQLEQQLRRKVGRGMGHSSHDHCTQFVDLVLDAQPGPGSPIGIFR
jgi:hypothetical protein